VSQLTKTETSLVIWLNIVTIFARSVRLLPATCAKTSTPLINCFVNTGQVTAMPNMQRMLFQFTTLVSIKLSAIYKEYFTGTGN